jgi:hypothetical protein
LVAKKFEAIGKGVEKGFSTVLSHSSFNSRDSRNKLRSRKELVHHMLDQLVSPNPCRLLIERGL